MSDADDRAVQLLADFFDNAPVGLHWVGPDGTVLRANRAELDMLGYEEHEYVGHPISEFHADAPAIGDILQRLTSGETLHSYEAQLRCKDGSIKHVLISSNVLREEGRFVHTRCFTRDITSLKETQQALAESERRKSAILSAALDAILTMDHEGLLIDLNPAAERIFGFQRGEALGRPLADLIIPERLRERHRQGLRHFLVTGEGPVMGRRIEIDALHARGHEYPVELSISVVGATAAPLFTATVRDISDRKAAEAELRAALEDRRILLESERVARGAAERLSDMKDEFLATLSHELRTPLSAILGWAQILRRVAGRPEELAKGLDVIERNSRIQTRLIDELLDTSRITSGKVRLDIQQIDPASFIRAAVETVKPAADAKGIRISLRLDPAADTIAGDPNRLQQVVWNLLSNAIKFTPQDGEVEVALARRGEHVEIGIVDNGSGITPDFLPHVFERFRQADASTTRRHGGLGLGLAIVRSLVEQHGGSVSAASAGENRGATFTVRLPVAARATGVEARFAGQAGSSVRAEADRSSEFCAADLSGLKVLVVDDEPDARSMLERVLVECKAAVLLAPSAAEALRLLDSQAPDVIVSDIGMPDTDGYELMRHVRRMPLPAGGVPAIALTAFARPEDRARALQAGFQEHLAKPVDPSELVARIGELAGRGPSGTIRG